VRGVLDDDAVASDDVSYSMVDARSIEGGKTWTTPVLVGPGSYEPFRNEARFCRPTDATGLQCTEPSTFLPLWWGG
jgi:hypothetical protein